MARLVSSMSTVLKLKLFHLLVVTAHLFILYISAATLLLFNGDVLGASGIMSSFVVAPKATLLNPKNQWKLFFIVTFFLASRIYILIKPSALDDMRTGVDAAIPIVSPLGFLIGGFLVGFG